MILTVGNTKGGVGKTTLAVNIAIARALAGRDVWLVDADRQGTAQMAISIRADAGILPGIAGVFKQTASKFHRILSKMLIYKEYRSFPTSHL